MSRGYRPFNRGKWQTARERHHLAHTRPDAGPREAVSMAQVLTDVMKRLRLDSRHWEALIADAWTEIVGDDVAKHSRPAGVNGKNLLVYVDSSAWLSEIQRYGRSAILANLRQRYGEGKIASVSFRLDPGK